MSWDFKMLVPRLLAIVIGCVTAMKMRLHRLLRMQRAQADAVASYKNGMKGVTCDTSAS
jgi:uncharacterized integral membrane protein